MANGSTPENPNSSILSQEIARNRQEINSNIPSRVNNPLNSVSAPINNPEPTKSEETGFQKLSKKIYEFIAKCQSYVEGIFYGKYELQGQKVSKIRKLLDRGLLSILTELASVDLCNVLNTIAGSRINSLRFNPNKPPQDRSSIEYIIWSIQFKAYTIQKLIDDFLGVYETLIGENQVYGIRDIMFQLNAALEDFTSTDGINNPQFSNQFSEVLKIDNLIKDKLQKINEFRNSLNLSTEQIQDAVNTIQQIRNVLVTIQSFNSPGAVISLANRISDGKVYEQIKSLEEKSIDLTKIVPTLKAINKKAQEINNIGRRVLGYVNSARAALKVLIILVKIYKTIKAFIQAVVILLPSVFSTVGTPVKFSEILQTKLKEQGEWRIFSILKSLNRTLGSVASFISSLVVIIQEIIVRLNIIILNLEACYPEIANELQNTSNSLRDLNDELQKFLSDYQERIKNLNTEIGPYKIFIIQEEVVDEGINLRRRYGIARDVSGRIVVQSTPTFASWDQIIIDEVKSLLYANGLLNRDLDFSAEELQILSESLAFLSDPDLNIDSVSTSPSDLAAALRKTDNPELENFADNLPGGKALRDKTRRRLIEQNEKFVSELKSSDPIGSKPLIDEKQKEINTLKIQDLESQKKDLKAALILSAANPAAAALIINKINQIDEKIKALKNS